MRRLLSLCLVCSVLVATCAAPAEKQETGAGVPENKQSAELLSARGRIIRTVKGQNPFPGDDRFPIVAVWRDGDVPQRPIVGLITYIWDDGTILWSKDNVYGGPPYYQGKVDRAGLDKTLRELRDAGVFSAPWMMPRFDSHVVCWYLFLVDGSKSFFTQTDRRHLYPEGGWRFDGNGRRIPREEVEEDLKRHEPDYPKFRATFEEIRAKVASLIPREGERLRLSHIRGRVFQDNQERRLRPMVDGLYFVLCDEHFEWSAYNDFKWYGPTASEGRIPKLHAARALAYIGDPAVPKLLQALEVQTADFDSVVDALTEIGLPVRQFWDDVSQRNSKSLAKWWAENREKTAPARSEFRKKIGLPPIIADDGSDAAVLSRVEALCDANGEARRQGFDLSRYKVTEVAYQPTQQEKRWVVHYRSNAAPEDPAGRFTVLVDEVTTVDEFFIGITGECTLVRGE